MNDGTRLCLAVTAAISISVAVARPAFAGEPSSTAGVWKKARAGSDLISSAKAAAVVEGSWSIALNLETILTNRTWDAPYPWGTLGQWTTRLSYGMSWTAMLGLESLAVFAASGGSVDWIGEASYRSDWIVTADAPSCPRPGARGGCGAGVGTFAFLQIRPARWRIWFEAGGGWIQQRIANDELRTVAESALVLTPISALYDLHTDLDDPVSVRLLAGPGVYAGIHNAHVHPTVAGGHRYDVPWTEMYPLDFGGGIGGRAELRLVFARRLGVDAEAVFAPMVVGGPSTERRPEIAPLDFEREGTTWWRKTEIGLSWDQPSVMPFRPTLALFAAELSDRSPEKIGHRGVMLRFDIPLRAR